ncbi:MAG: hypothetical protein QXE81_03160 [Desulfurococcaceae archaeon]
MSKELERYLYYPEMSPRRPMNAGYLKLLSLILVFMSIAGVFFAAQLSPAPLYRTRDLVGNFFLNYATVMIEGRIIEPVRLDVQAGGRIRLTLYLLEEDIESSEPFTIFVYDPVASAFLISENYVDFGDVVRLLIQVRVREEFTYGILQDPTHVVVLNRTTSKEPINVTGLTGIDQYTFVCAVGSVKNPLNVSTGLLFDLITRGERVKVLVPHTFRYRFAYEEGFEKIWENLNTPDSLLRVCGPVYYYRGTSPEIILLRMQDVTVIGEEQILEISFNELPDHINETVAVSGIFTKIGYDKGLYQIHLSDESGGNIIAYAERQLVIDSVDPWRIGVGSRLRIRGTVTSPTTINASKIEIIEINPPTNVTSIYDAIAQPHGSIVILWGVRVSSSNITTDGNWIVDVTDDSRTLRVFIPSSIARGIGASPPPVNSSIAVAGYRDVFQQYEEIIVYSENGLKILSEAAPPSPLSTDVPIIRIGELGNYVNRDVVISGELMAIRYNYSDRLYYVELQDDTGRVNVSMARDLAILIDPWNAGPGTIMKVNGTVMSHVLISGMNITILSSNPTPRLTIKEALGKPLGTMVAVVNARVVSSRATSGNDWQITITDESGISILVFIPRSIVAELGLSLPIAGSIVSVAGYRDIYAGTEEIVVYSKLGYRQEG